LPCVSGIPIVGARLSLVDCSMASAPDGHPDGWSNDQNLWMTGKEYLPG